MPHNIQKFSSQLRKSPIHQMFQAAVLPVLSPHESQGLWKFSLCFEQWDQLRLVTVLTTGCPRTGGWLSSSLSEEISSMFPNRSMVPLEASMLERNAQLKFLWKILQMVLSLSLQHIPKIHKPNLNKPNLKRAPWAWPSEAWGECLWRRKGINLVENKVVVTVSFQDTSQFLPLISLPLCGPLQHCVLVGLCDQ